MDVPSGWDVNKGNVNNLFEPSVLVSLSTAKLCSQEFKGEHYLGGRFIPEKVAKMFSLELPSFKEDKEYVLLHSCTIN